MRNYELKLGIVLMLNLLQTSLSAQVAVVASGGVAKGDGSISYSVGQTFYTTSKGSNGSETKGIQQPYEISVIMELEKSKEMKLNIVVWPNPVIDELALIVEEPEISNLSYQLYNIEGKLLNEENINNNRTNIIMNKHPKSMYFIKVFCGKKEIKVFKIIKK
ncbi:MAG: T9SS type A sorting domain-containing protein [Bacteroidales bacterium]|nr:T9SS type A sorting domain-containing protein [Bacteroidales bacterium]